MEKRCITCNKIFNVKPSVIKRGGGRGKYCSIRCARFGRIGRTFGKPFKKGHTPWNKNTKGIQKFFDATRNKMRISHLDLLKEEKHHNWRGGKVQDSRGYVLIKKYNHPRGNRRNYVFEHILILEKSLNRSILKYEKIHHINRVKNDNRLQNLILFSSSGAHRRFHYNETNIKNNEIIFDGRNFNESRP